MLGWLLVLDYIMPTKFLQAFLKAISILFSVFKTPWLESLLAQLPTPPLLSIHFIGFLFGNESIINWLLLSTVHSITPALNTYVIFTTFLHSITSASLSLPQSPLPTSRVFRNTGPSLWNSLAPHQRLLHCLQI